MKEIEIEIGRVVNAYEGLLSIKSEVRIDVAWSIDDLKEALKKHVDRHNGETLKNLEKFGTSTGIPGKYNITDIKAYQDAQKALDEIKVKVKFSPLSYNVLVEQGITLSSQFSLALRPFIEMPKKKEDEKTKTIKKKEEPTKETQNAPATAKESA